MAANDHKIRNTDMRCEQRDIRFRSSRHLLGESIDFQEPIGLSK